jgi:hypothetical protein
MTNRLVKRLRGAEEKTLRFRTTRRAEAIELFCRFDALGDG